MDALTDILNTLRMQSSLYFRTEMTAPWGVAVPAKGKVARFHIAIRGQCWLRVEGESKPLFLANGDLVIIPHGAAHVMGDTQETAAKPLADVLSETQFTGEGPLVYGGGGAGCTLVCGEFAFDERETHPLLDNLPSVLSITADQGHHAKWLDAVMGFVAHEAAQMRPGAHAIIHRLSDIIFIQAIRLLLDNSPHNIPFLSAFADNRISTVLSRIHADPQYKWSVESLGQIANMSRSAFSNRFSELTQMSPLQYVMFIRLNRASRLLIESDYSLAQIAELVGYQSEAAFSLAFTKQFDCRPGEYRRRASTQ